MKWLWWLVLRKIPYIPKICTQLLHSFFNHLHYTQTMNKLLKYKYLFTLSCLWYYWNSPEIDKEKMRASLHFLVTCQSSIVKSVSKSAILLVWVCCVCEHTHIKIKHGQMPGIILSHEFYIKISDGSLDCNDFIPR